MFIRYILKLKLYVFVGAVFLLSLTDAASAQRSRNNKTFEEGENEEKRDKVTLGEGVNMYIGKDVVATVNSDFIVVGNKNSPQKDETGSPYRIHLDDTSKLQVTKHMIIDEDPGNEFLFNMGKDAYFVMASDNDPQKIATEGTYPQNAKHIIIPHLAIDGKGNKFLTASVKTEKLNVNNSRLDLLKSDLIIDEANSSETENPISGERGFISNTLNGVNETDPEAIDSDIDRGRLILHLKQDRHYKIPLGYNEAGYNDVPRIITISSNENATLGFQMLHNTPNPTVEPKDLGKINDIYYYKLFNVSNNDVNSMKLNMEVAYDRTKEGDFSDLAYYFEDSNEWVNLSKVLQYSDLSIKNSSGSLVSSGSGSSNSLHRFRSLDVKDLSLSPQIDDNNRTLMHNRNTAEEGGHIVFALVKGANAKFFIPSIFTPNNDNINDTFEITGLYDKSLNGTAVMSIYRDLRGTPNLVYKDDKYSGGWDGRGLPDGVYYYKITIINKNKGVEEFSGPVTIKRN